jgi:hypothetical protein
MATVSPAGLIAQLTAGFVLLITSTAANQFSPTLARNTALLYRRLVLLLLLRRALHHGHDWRYQCSAEAAKAGVSVSRLERKSETNVAHTFEVRPRKDHRGVDLISDALPFGRLWYGGPNAVENAIGYALHRSRSSDAIIRVYDEAGNVIDTYEHRGDFQGR